MPHALVYFLALFGLLRIDSFLAYSLGIARPIDRHAELLRYLRPDLVSCPPVVNEDDQIQADVVEESHEDEDLDRDDDPRLHLRLFLRRDRPVLLPVQVERYGYERENSAADPEGDVDDHDGGAFVDAHLIQRF